MCRDHFGSDRHKTNTRSGYLQSDTSFILFCKSISKNGIEAWITYAYDENHGSSEGQVVGTALLCCSLQAMN